MLIQTGHFCGTENNKNAEVELFSANVEEQTSQKFGNIQNLPALLMFCPCIDPSSTQSYLEISFKYFGVTSGSFYEKKNALTEDF